MCSQKLGAIQTKWRQPHTGVGQRLVDARVFSSPPLGEPSGPGLVWATQRGGSPIDPRWQGGMPAGAPHIGGAVHSTGWQGGGHEGPGGSPRVHTAVAARPASANLEPMQWWTVPAQVQGAHAAVPQLVHSHMQMPAAYMTAAGQVHEPQSQGA